jgi:cytochrome c biogenesis protein CcdA
MRMPHPLAWFIVGIVELFVVLSLLLFWVPDSWPHALKTALAVLALVAVTVGSLVFVRRVGQGEGTTAP